MKNSANSFLAPYPEWDVSIEFLKILKLKFEPILIMPVISRESFEKIAHLQQNKFFYSPVTAGRRRRCILKNMTADCIGIGKKLLKQTQLRLLHSHQNEKGASVSNYWFFSPRSIRCRTDSTFPRLYVVTLAEVERQLRCASESILSSTSRC